MKRKIWCLILALSLLLCACQADPAPDVDAPTPDVTDDESQSSPASLPPSETPTESTSEQASSQADAREPEFTQTDSFPMPFDGEMSVNGFGELVLTSSEALYDYDTMWLLLEENFPYLDRIEAEMGIDWRTVRDRYRERMDQRGRRGDGWLTQAEFIVIINGCLKEFHNVGHLFLLDPSMWQSYGDKWVTSDGTLYPALARVMKNPRSEQFYQAWEKLTDGYATGLSAKGSIVDGKTVAPGITLHTVEDIPYVKISTFSSSSWTDETYAALSQFFSEIEDKEHLIIDVRGNGGGDNIPWMYHIVEALAEEPMTNEMFFAAKTGSLNLALNPQFSDPVDTVYTDGSWQEEFPYIQPEYVEGMDLLFKVTQRLLPSEAGTGFQGKIWVLVDKGCYSSTDQFAVFCKATGFATLVGEETGGNGIGLQPYVMALPYSGLVIYYEPYLSFNPDGSCNGIKGTQPDVIPEEGQSALDACLAAIHAEKTKK